EAMESNISLVNALPAKSPSEHNLKQLINTLGQLWSNGLRPDWNKLHKKIPNKTRLPLYPFQTRQYWINSDSHIDNLSAQSEVSSTKKITGPGEWVYSGVWHQAPLTRYFPPPGRGKNWLLIIPDKINSENIICSHLPNQLATYIENSGDNVFKVYQADNFTQTDYRSFECDCNSLQGCQQIRDILVERGLPADYVLDLRWLALEGSSNHIGTDTGENLITGFNAVLQSWAETQQGLRLCVLTQSGCQVNVNEHTNVIQAAVRGLTQVAAQEYPHISCRHIDLGRNEKYDTEMIWSDIRDENATLLTAWRQQQRWQYTYSQLVLPDIPEQLNKKSPSIQRSARYLILGYVDQGLGKVWADYIMQRCQGELILGLCQTDTNHSLSQSWLNQIKENSTCNLNVVDNIIPTPEGLREFFENLLKNNHQTIDGVFVSVPTTDSRSTAPLALMQKEHWQYNINHRLRLIDSFVDAVEILAPNWVCIQSSMSVVLGGIGLAPYAAANHVLDTLIQNKRTSNLLDRHNKTCQWFNIHWDALLHNDQESNQTAQIHTQALQEHALNNQEVWQVTERILATCLPDQYTVSRNDLDHRLTDLNKNIESEDESKSTRKTHQRPTLSTPYRNADNEIEEFICSLWEELLRLEKVGADDSFFDLGGQSLLAIQAINRLRQRYPVQLDMRELLEGTPTAANIAINIKRQLPDSDEIDELNKIIEEVESLTDDDVKAMLDQNIEIEKDEVSS
ncbi:MAG: KR domain-containing protein, partial [Pseudomonadota bacterium]